MPTSYPSSQTQPNGFSADGQLDALAKSLATANRGLRGLEAQAAHDHARQAIVDAVPFAPGAQARIDRTLTTYRVNVGQGGSR